MRDATHTSPPNTRQFRLDGPENNFLFRSLSNISDSEQALGQASPQHRVARVAKFSFLLPAIRLFPILLLPFFHGFPNGYSFRIVLSFTFLFIYSFFDGPVLLEFTSFQVENILEDIEFSVLQPASW